MRVLVIVLAVAPLVLAQTQSIRAGLSKDYFNYDKLGGCGRAPLNPRKKGSNKVPISPYVLNGNTVIPGEWPFIAQVSINGTRCSGVIVGKNLVLTAALCVYLDEPFGKYFELGGSVDAYVIVGQVDQDNPGRHMQKIKVKATQDGAFFTQRGFNADLPNFARLWLVEPIKFSDYVQPVCLPSRPRLITRLVSSRVFAIGYGATEENFPEGPIIWPRHAQWAEMKRCNQEGELVPFGTYEEKATNIFFRTPLEKNINLCIGDLGAPFVALDPNNRWSLVGITSGAAEVCSGGQKEPVVVVAVNMAKIIGIFDKNFRVPPGTAALVSPRWKNWTNKLDWYRWYEESPNEELFP